ncbi:hypothetical protein PISL3812_08971 [Talaromyces islandicus]|uniref:DUF676 domain-containing protein n=1 Tax=Talaromyces islandicus TaxID=28573 RepID=A0A0U1M8J8_TALIS|nr:hypothetical protein PISL3812_08971 [Talaromyces islandicus]
MVVMFMPSQVGATTTTPLPYTANPLKLLVYDAVLCLSCIRYLPDILMPLRPCYSGKLDELYPSRGNLTALTIHGVLIVYQIAFILSLPALFFLPIYVCILYIASVFILNNKICAFLNGRHRFLVSHVPLPNYGHESEHWIFINGVGVGQHWLQSNIDRLSLTFGRKITGVHNDTAGIIFDVIQCLIQRCFCYATEDVRDAYVFVKEAILNTKYKKIVLILHSQGAVEGGLILDWLFDTLDEKALGKLEIYTFGNAANHWNNPIRRYTKQDQPEKCIPHIEHYVNSEDFVAMWGVLNFMKIPGRYLGDVFIRQGAGHLLNQHYLDTMFPLDHDQKPMLEENGFLEQNIKVIGCESTFYNTDFKMAAKTLRDNIGESALKIRNCSRLWRYRNGRTPDR